MAISLVREHSLTMRPPRALWVPFPLGRPFGAPGDADFQARVVRSALDMLDIVDGPVLHADFPDDAPGPKALDMTGWVCPIPLKALPDDGEPWQALMREVAALMPWYDVSRERRGRTTVGLSGVSVEEAARVLVAFLATPPSKPHSAAVLKNASADLHAYYVEAATAQPGTRSAADVETWFWEGTVAARLFRELRTTLASSPDPAVRRVATRLLVPKTAGG